MSANNPPVILLCGAENTLSIARSLGKKGIPVTVAARPGCQGLHSRYVNRKYVVPEGSHPKAYYKQVLLGPESAALKGSVLLCCGDYGIEFVIENHPALAEKYILDIQKPHLQQALLDKQETLRMAEAAGIGFPKFWNIASLADIESIAEQVNYPAIIKPIHSHRFVSEFGVKLFQVDNAEALHQLARKVDQKGLEYMVSEYIPGPDSLLSSFYTHIDDDGHALFRFTKRIIRRMPPNFGGACYHETCWLPETAALGERFFRSIGFTGMANIEFKHDLRDGQLKVIECNARFTAAQELMRRSGMDIAFLIYRYLVDRAEREAAKDGIARTAKVQNLTDADKSKITDNNKTDDTGRIPTVTQYREHLFYWYPREDFRSYLTLAKSGQLTFLKWLKSLAHFPLVLPNWSLSDPWPTFVSLGDTLRNRLGLYKPWK